MSTDIEESSDLVSTPVAGDLTNELVVIARTPGEMRTAKAALAQWFAAKVALCEKDEQELADSIDVALRNNWSLKALEGMHRRAVGRLRYYEKCKAAVDAGYCIVPNFPVDVFAVRTKRKRPAQTEATHSWAVFTQSSECPPLGAGKYKDSVPVVSTYTENRENSKGESVPTRVYYPSEFEEVEFPISVAKPQIMSATAQAMALKCFDEMGVLPARRAKGDPIVVGIIRESGSSRAKAMTFMVAWLVDTKDL